MGKTSFMMRILAHAREQGARTVHINMRMVDQSILGDLDRALFWFCAMVGRRLGVHKRHLREHWDDIFGAKDNCTSFFEEFLLPDDGESLVLAIDQLDCILEAPAVALEFLSLLRVWHELGKERGAWAGLRLIIVHSTESYLPMDINSSPFNVGLPVVMSDWSAASVEELSSRHGLSLNPGQLEQLVALIGGHPYLVSVALYHLSQGVTFSDLLASAATDEGVFADHLKFLLWHLQRHSELGAAAAQIITATEPVQLPSALAFKLVSLGLVHLRGNSVVFARSLYDQYLSERLTIS